MTFSSDISISVNRPFANDSLLPMRGQRWDWWSTITLSILPDYPDFAMEALAPVPVQEW